MRGVWVDAGQDVDAAKLRAHGIDSAYFDIREPRVTRAYLDNVKAQGFAPGVYAAWNWNPAWTGAAFADWLSRMLSQLDALPTEPDYPRVLVDMETHALNYIRAFFTRWREHRPKRTTDWTLEGYQGGLFNPDDVQAILHANVRVLPQLYKGDMSPHSPGVILDLLIAGFPGSVLYGMYDAARLPYTWRGCAFSQGRLP